MPPEISYCLAQEVDALEFHACYFPCKYEYDEFPRLHSSRMSAGAFALLAVALTCKEAAKLAVVAGLNVPGRCRKLVDPKAHMVRETLMCAIQGWGLVPEQYSYCNYCLRYRRKDHWKSERDLVCRVHNEEWDSAKIELPNYAITWLQAVNTPIEKTSDS